MSRRWRIATRGSPLALAQAERVRARLGAGAELRVVTTTGDRHPDAPISTLGGTGAFVKEVQEAVLAGDADVAVHSAKDLPPRPVEGLVLAAVPERADPRDALVGGALDALPTGARVGTGSARRRAQLAAARPDLTFAELRGNIATRLARVAELEAVVVAAAALDRLGLAGRAAERLDPEVMLPQVGQGTIAVECRTDDRAARDALAALDDPDAAAALTAERAFLDALGGGCTLPCGALAAGGTLTGMLASGDGRIVLRVTRCGDDPVRLGREVADALWSCGGRDLLEDRR